MSLRDQLDNIDREIEHELSDNSNRPNVYNINNYFISNTLPQQRLEAPAQKTLLFDFFLWSIISWVTVTAIILVSVVR